MGALLRMINENTLQRIEQDDDEITEVILRNPYNEELWHRLIEALKVNTNVHTLDCRNVAIPMEAWSLLDETLAGFSTDRIDFITTIHGLPWQTYHIIADNIQISLTRNQGPDFTP